MIATHATKAGVRYRYYVSQPGLHGEARTATLGSRMPSLIVQFRYLCSSQRASRPGSSLPD
jgi:hypothetical protein